MSGERPRKRKERGLEGDNSVCNSQVGGGLRKIRKEETEEETPKRLQNTSGRRAFWLGRVLRGLEPRKKNTTVHSWHRELSRLLVGEKSQTDSHAGDGQDRKGGGEVYRTKGSEPEEQDRHWLLKSPPRSQPRKFLSRAPRELEKFLKREKFE